MNRAAVREVADLYYARFDARLEKGPAEVRAEFTKELAEARVALETRIANQRADLVKWLFMFWVGTIVPPAGLMIALTRL